MPIPTDLEPDQETMLKELREGEPRVELSLRVEKYKPTFLSPCDHGEFPIVEGEGSTVRTGVGGAPHSPPVF